MSPRAALRSTENPLPRRRNWSPVWVPGGIFTLALLPSIDRHLDLAAERRLGHPQRHAHEDVGAVALEDRMRHGSRHARRDRRSARPGRPASPSPARRMRVPSSTPAGIATCRRALALHRAGAVADLHGLRITRPGAAAGRAGALDQEEALLRAHLAGALAGGQVSAARALSSDPVPLQASQTTRVGTRSVDLGAGEGLGQVDLDAPGGGRAGAGAACGAAARPPMKSPNIWSKMSPEAAAAEKSKPPHEPAAAAALLERGVAEAVVGGALLVVLQDVVGLVDFLELGLGLLVARVAVGVILHRELAIRLLQVVRARIPRHAQAWRNNPAWPSQPF